MEQDKILFFLTLEKNNLRIIEKYVHSWLFQSRNNFKQTYSLALIVHVPLDPSTNLSRSPRFS